MHSNANTICRKGNRAVNAALLIMLRKRADIKKACDIYFRLEEIHTELMELNAIMANEIVPKSDPITLKSWKAEDSLLELYAKLGIYIVKQTGKTVEEARYDN